MDTGVVVVIKLFSLASKHVSTHLNINKLCQIYYPQFDKHNFIDFHRVNCNEPSSKFAVVIANAIGYRFSCKS